MPINLLSAGGGTTTLTTASSASNFTVTVPAETGTIVTTANLPAPASLSTASGSAPSYSARAWVNFNGTGTVAIRASGNVSSITDNGTGDYTVNFTTAMPDANYVPYGSAVTPAISEVMLVLGRTTAQTTSSIRIATLQYNGTSPVDQLFVSVAVIR